MGGKVLGDRIIENEWERQTNLNKPVMGGPSYGKHRKHRGLPNTVTWGTPRKRKGLREEKGQKPKEETQKFFKKHRSLPN